MIKGNIERSYDVDVFCLEVNASQHLEIVTTGHTSVKGTLSKVDIYRGGFGWGDIADGRSVGANFRIDTAVEPGIYCVTVAGRNRLRTGPYRLGTRGVHVASSIGPKVMERGKDIEVGSVFRDCPECPLMVVVPGGSFRMGGTRSQVTRDRNSIFSNERAILREHPLTEVRVGGSRLTPFAIGVYEVTHGEWLACWEDGGCSIRPKSIASLVRPPREDSSIPVSHVSPLEIEEYLRWLSRKTGQIYELPTEAEWEYAARGGTQTKFSIGDYMTSYFVSTPSALQYMDPVGSYAPNPFGLHDVHGSVWELTADCRNPNLSEISREGEMPEGDCGFRVTRGGGWPNRFDDLRTARRGWHHVRERKSEVGFRVVRRLRVDR